MSIFVNQAKRLMDAWHNTTKEGLSRETVQDIDATAMYLEMQLEEEFTEHFIEEIPEDKEIVSQETKRAFFALVGMVSCCYCPFILLPAVIGFLGERAVDPDLERVQKADCSLKGESLKEENRDGPFPKFDDHFVGKVKGFLGSVYALQENKKFSGKAFALLSHIYSSWVGELTRNRLPVDLSDVPSHLPTSSKLEG